MHENRKHQKDLQKNKHDIPERKVHDNWNKILNQTPVKDGLKEKCVKRETIVKLQKSFEVCDEESIVKSTLDQREVNRKMKKEFITVN